MRECSFDFFVFHLELVHYSLLSLKRKQVKDEKEIKNLDSNSQKDFEKQRQKLFELLVRNFLNA
jgi:hypothetical protein